MPVRTIGDTSASFTVGEWKPDPDVVAENILHFAHGLEDMRAPLERAKQALIYSTELHFETKSDPENEPWVKLSADYAEWKFKKVGSGEADLVLTGALKEQATSEEAWEVAGNSVYFNVFAIPEYGPYHQAGTQHTFAARSYRAANDKFVANMELSSKEVQILEKGPKGLNLPRRAFIGADEETILEIEQIFLEWMEELENRWIIDTPDIPGSEFPLGFGTNILGTYPVMGFTRRGQPILRTPRGPRFGTMGSVFGGLAGL